MTSLPRLGGDSRSFAALDADPAESPAVRHPSELQAFAGFTVAATAALGELSRQLPGVDLWLVTRLDGEHQEVITRTGRWSLLAPAGLRVAWAASLCVRMLAGQGPMVAPNIVKVPAYRQAAVGRLAAVRAYVGVPLYGFDRRLFGTLCGLAGQRQPASMTRQLPLVETMARLLSTVLNSERLAHDRSTEAAAAYGLIDRDPATALRNRRGFEQMSQAEQARSRLYGAGASVLAVQLDLSGAQSWAAANDEVIKRVGGLLVAACTGCDVIARVEQDQFAILAPELDEAAGRRLAARLRRALRELPVPAVIGTATQRAGGPLEDTHLRAGRAVRAHGASVLRGVRVHAPGGRA